MGTKYICSHSFNINVLMGKSWLIFRSCRIHLIVQILGALNMFHVYKLLNVPFSKFTESGLCRQCILVDVLASQGVGILISNFMCMLFGAMTRRCWFSVTPLSKQPPSGPIWPCIPSPNFSSTLAWSVGIDKSLLIFNVVTFKMPPGSHFNFSVTRLLNFSLALNINPQPLAGHFLCVWVWT